MIFPGRVTGASSVHSSADSWFPKATLPARFFGFLQTFGSRLQKRNHIAETAAFQQFVLS